jgi:hypothetical protein
MIIIFADIGMRDKKSFVDHCRGPFCILLVYCLQMKPAGSHSLVAGCERSYECCLLAICTPLQGNLCVSVVLVIC